ncbi:UNVERIFIED_CONTAM: hypothetical protein K2H54_002341 [Gekko kuhli]
MDTPVQPGDGTYTDLCARVCAVALELFHIVGWCWRLKESVERLGTVLKAGGEFLQRMPWRVCKKLGSWLIFSGKAVLSLNQPESLLALWRGRKGPREPLLEELIVRY